MLLHAFLRQDPDVILIGETRDPETAESSMDAAETGHLVFTTLHANTATSSLTRLLDIGSKYKLNASVRAVLAQRLLRKVCVCSVRGQLAKMILKGPVSDQIQLLDMDCSFPDEKKKRARERLYV